MTRPPSSGERAAGGAIAFVVVAAMVLGFLHLTGVIDAGHLLPDTSATGAAPSRGAKPGQKAEPKGGHHKVTLRSGANLRGQPITKFTMDYLVQVADVYGGDLVVSYGTAGQHVPNSHHYDGNAADIGMGDNGSRNDSAVGDRIMRACLIVAGDPPEQATRLGQKGGLIVRRRKGVVFECIWKVANHHDHVHVAAAPE